MFEAEEGKVSVKTLVKGEIGCLEFRECSARHSEPVRPPGPSPSLRHQEARDKWTNLN